VQLVIANYILQRNPYQKLLLVGLYFVLSENVVAFSIIMVKERRGSIVIMVKAISNRINGFMWPVEQFCIVGLSQGM